MNQQGKQQRVEEIRDMLKDAQGIYLVDFTGMSVEEANTLRAEFADKHLLYRVIKNTLALRAIDSLGLDELRSYFKDTTALAVSKEDPATPAKVLVDFAKKFDKPKIKAAVIDGIVYTGDIAEKFASLPSKDQLYAQVLGAMMSPVSGFAGVLVGVLRQVVGTLDAVRIQKEEA